MKTLRKLVYGETLLSIALITGGFLTLFAFFDLADELQNLGRSSGAEGPTYQLRHAVLHVALLLPSLGPLTIPVGVYTLVIAAMLWRATLGLGRPGVDPTLARLAAAGALLFVVSDAILAINKFHSPLPLARLLNMSSYWGGQALLCAAALHLPPPSPPPGEPAHAHPR
jgi:uncharacterized membrane protein YhhN